MNKIILVDDNISTSDCSSNIDFKVIDKNALFDVNTLEIIVKNSCDLYISYENQKLTKLNIEINVLKNVSLNLYEYRSGVECKNKYHYNIDEGSTLNIYKLYDSDIVKEFVRIDLNGLNAKVNYNFKTVSKNSEKYDLTIYHNHKNTYSHINNNGINIKDGNLTFNVSSFASSGISKCEVIQKSRIINLTDNKCQINPNLYIDEYDIEASHSAHIGTFSYDELFYLMSRGINLKEATYLLIKGFLENNMSKLDKKVEEICLKYWR